MPTFIRVLGALTVEVDGEAIELPAITQRRALIFLVVHVNEVVTADQLADAVWLTESPKQIGHAVHSLVYRLRQHVVGRRTGEAHGLIERADPGYRLTIDRLHIDANLFTSQTNQARQRLPADPAAARSMLTESLALWRGEALLDVTYDAWAAAEIRRLGETRLTACEAMAEANIVLGDPEVAVAELESLTERFPLRESLWELLWRAMAAAGRYLEVTASHRRAIELIDQLDVRPSEHLAELARTYSTAG